MVVFPFAVVPATDRREWVGLKKRNPRRLAPAGVEISLFRSRYGAIRTSTTTTPTSVARETLPKV